MRCSIGVEEDPHDIFRTYVSQTRYSFGITATHRSGIVALVLVCELGNRRRKFKQRRPQMIPSFFAITSLVIALFLLDFEMKREL
jgi:hypothetical protein